MNDDEFRDWLSEPASDVCGCQEIAEECECGDCLCADCDYEIGMTMLFFDVIEALVTQRRNRGDDRTATRMVVISRATEQRDQLCGASIFDMLWPEETS